MLPLYAAQRCRNIMKHIIIGTAGHIDHGKTCLTEALTGRNTDRLEEEKKRGITIENGFAMLELPDGQTASIIDVPGHEKFVRNMIVGATGIDLAMMVIAADDGFMPQTQEHLDILQLLEVKNGIIALTKTDIADEEWIETVEEDIRDRVAGTFLENAPIVRVSSHTGAGIEELKNVIFESVKNSVPKNTDLPARLPADRVFTVQGFGTVVTGTLTEGVFRTGDEVCIYPSGEPVRIRELQNHDNSVEEVQAGMRSAVNLAGIEKDKIKRGDVVAAQGSVAVTKRIDVTLKITDECPFFIKNASRLHLFHGTSESICKIRLLDADEMGPGESGFAQLILEEPVSARNGDRFIIRFFSPVVTVGGGRMLDVNAGHRKRSNEAVLKRLAALSSENMEERILQYTEDRGAAVSAAGALALTANETQAAVSAALEKLAAEGLVIRSEKGYTGKAAYESYKRRIVKLLSEYHENYPLRSGMPAAAFRTETSDIDAEAAQLLLAMASADGDIVLKGDVIAVSGFEPKLSDKQKKLAENMYAYYKSAGFETRSLSAAADEMGENTKICTPVYEYLCSDRRLVIIGPDEAVTAEKYDEALQKMKEIAQKAGEVTLGEFRTEMGFSRKYAQMYLEYWDRAGITRRQGDSHILK